MPRATVGRPGPPKPFFWRFKVDQEHHRLVPFGAVGGSPNLGARRVETTRATGTKLLPMARSRSSLYFDVCPRSVLSELRTPHASRRDNIFLAYLQPPRARKLGLDHGGRTSAWTQDLVPGLRM